MTTDDADNGWDSLAQEFGLPTSAPSPDADRPEPAKSPARPPAPRPARDPRPEIETEADDFGAGVTDEPSRREAFYDPGPDAVADDTEEFDDAGPELLEDEIEDTSPLPSVSLSKKATVESVREAIAALPVDFREVVVLRELEGLSYKEISEVSGVPLGTVMSRLARARHQLYLLLSD